MKKCFFVVALLFFFRSAEAQLSATAFSKQCETIGLQFSPAMVQQNFKAITLDSTVAKQYDYAIASTDGKMEYRYRLAPSVKDSAAAAFTTQYLFYEAAKIKAGYPAIQINPYKKETVAAAYKASGGHSAAFKTGDFMSSDFATCSCFAFYKEAKGMFIIYMLTNDTKLLLEEKYAAGLVGVLLFK